MLSNSSTHDKAFKALDAFQIEIPSWGFANTGTRFGKFVQAAAASTIEEKFSDAAEVHKLTGVTPTMALHVLWDLPKGLADVEAGRGLATKFERRAGGVGGSRDVAAGWVELCRHAEYSKGDWLAGGGAGTEPCGNEAGTAAGGGVQALRTSFLSHGHSRLGDGAALGQGCRAAGQGA